MRTICLPLIGFTLAVAGCGDGASTNDAAAPETASVEEAPGEGGVTRTEVAAPAPPPAPTPPPAAIQVQPGDRNAQVALQRVQVVGDVMTVQMTYTGADSFGFAVMPIEEISVIDDATSQRLGVLKDNAGKALASPLNSDGTNIRINVQPTPTVVWAKFPAPPATSPTVSINFPTVAPFDGVPVQR